MRVLTGSRVGLRLANEGAPTWASVMNLSCYSATPKSPSGIPCYSRIFCLVSASSGETAPSALPLVTHSPGPSTGLPAPCSPATGSWRDRSAES